METRQFGSFSWYQNYFDSHNCNQNTFFTLNESHDKQQDVATGRNHEKDNEKWLEEDGM